MTALPTIQKKFKDLIKQKTKKDCLYSYIKGYVLLLSLYPKKGLTPSQLHLH